MDDVGDIRTVLDYHLTKLGYDVVPCDNGTDALKQFLDSFRCCDNAGILMDLTLPDINGLRVLTAIREIEKGSATGCVPVRMGLISATSEVVVGTEVFESLGPILRLDKPFDLESMAPKIEAWLEGPPPELYALRAGHRLMSGADLGPALRDLSRDKRR